MALKSLCEEIKNVRTYLIKIGPSRRQGQILKTKLDEANKILEKYNSYVDTIKIQINLGKLTSDEVKEVNRQCDVFKLHYNDVLILCTEKQISSESEENMEEFNLKTALTLLPLMSDDEVSTKQLIDSIEYYGVMLQKPECKANLIKFILKNRLSQSAKLKLDTDYSSIEDLVQDMRKQLLPRKSATAIQSRLQNLRQNEKTIADFGKEITELFVDLTISQADGKKESYNVLKPLNEKFAIKKFADGLRNRRLSTIIAARDFTSLKDAVQAAQDEEVSSGPSGEVMSMYRSRNNNYGSSRGKSNYFNRGYRGNTFQVRGNPHFTGFRPPRYFTSQHYSNRRGGRFATQAARRGNRGRGKFNSNFSRRNINSMTSENDKDHESNDDSLNHFFRA